MLRTTFPLIVLGLALASTARAEDQSVVSSARELAKQGLMAYDAGKYEQAAEMLNKAYQVVHVPTLAVNVARAYVKLGRLVAASETYLEASRIPKDKSWQATQDDAVGDALKERGDLLPRIPRLKILVEGARAEDVSVAVDSQLVPTALLGSEQLLDPGEHKIEAHRGMETVTRTVTLKESEQHNETLHFAATAGSAASATTDQTQKTSAATPETAAPSKPPEDSAHGNTQRLLGWLGVGIGSATIGFGAVTGVLALSKRSSLRNSNQCDKDVRSCTADQSSGVDTYNTYRDLSSVGFIVGGVLAATGVTLLLTSPKSEAPVKTGVWVSPNGAALHGAF